MLVCVLCHFAFSGSAQKCWIALTEPVCKEQSPGSQPSKPGIRISSLAILLSSTNVQRRGILNNHLHCISFCFLCICAENSIRPIINCGSWYRCFHIYTNPIQPRLRRYDVPQMPYASYMAFAHHRKFHHQSQLSNPQNTTPTTQLCPALSHKQYYPNPQFSNLITIFSFQSQAKMSALRLLTTRVAGRAPSARLFTTTTPFKKTAAETAKETIEKANKTAGEAGVAAIEKGRTSFSSLPNPSPYPYYQWLFYPINSPFPLPLPYPPSSSSLSSPPSSPWDRSQNWQWEWQNKPPPH